jgi:hypothetical protein
MRFFTVSHMLLGATVCLISPNIYRNISSEIEKSCDEGASLRAYGKKFEKHVDSLARG